MIGAWLDKIDSEIYVTNLMKKYNFQAQPWDLKTVIGEYDDEKTAQNVASYMRTKFFRYLVSFLKNTQNAYKKVYTHVPVQDFSKTWTDEELYAKYDISVSHNKNIVLFSFPTVLLAIGFCKLTSRHSLFRDYP